MYLSLDHFDGCPDRETMRRFSTDPGFVDAIARAGLPAPRIQEIGEVAGSVIRPEAVSR